jgi:5'-3' exonuclease
MNDGPKLLLIDGNNMSHRVFWTHQELQYHGRHTGVLFGFFRQLIYLRKKFPEYFFIVAWDRGYARRKAESQAGVAAGIIPSAYKEPREIAKAEADLKRQEEMESLRIQMEQLRDEALPLARCTQAIVDHTEADDLIYTYCLYVHKWAGRAIVVSSDKDFYQVLGIGPEITVFDAMKDETWTAERFQMEFAFPASLWVTVGALMGEGPTGDNIFGVDGWGPKTSCDYVRQYGNLDAVIAAVQAKGKHSKKEQTLLASIPRARLAMSLKKMDEVPYVPMPRCGPKPAKPLHDKFLELGFVSLLKDVGLLTA